VRDMDGISSSHTLIALSIHKLFCPLGFVS